MNRIDDTLADVRAWLQGISLSVLARSLGVSTRLLYKVRDGGAVTVDTLSKLEDARLGRRKTWKTSENC